MIIEVFKAGTHEAKNGEMVTYSVEDLKAIADLYNKTIAEDPSRKAPCVIGHEVKESDPAQGWVNRVAVDGDIMKAYVDFTQDFMYQLKNGLYRNVSIRLNQDNLLEHVAFLGAVHGAVKGIKPVELSAHQNSRVFEYCATCEPTDLPPVEQETPKEPTPEEPKEYSQSDIEFSDKLAKKPKEGYKSTDYADDVHCRYAIKTPTQIKASMAAFKRDFAKKSLPYSERAINYVRARLLKAALNSGIQPKGETWQSDFAMVSVPTELLTKNQLKDIVDTLHTTNTPTKEDYMDETTNGANALETWVSGLASFLSGKAAEVSEELGTMVPDWIEEYKASNPMPTMDAPAEPAAETSLSQPEPAPNENKEFSQAQERIATLEKKLRNAENETWFNDLLGKNIVLPKQKAAIMSALDAPYVKDFAQGSLDASIKKVIESFEPRSEFKEFATAPKAATKKVKDTLNLAPGVVADPDRMKLHERTLAIANDKGISYTAALNIAQKEGVN